MWTVRLPNADEAVVADEKIARYLLSPAHPTGRHKATFFRRFGFTADRPEEFMAALREHARQNEVARSDDTPFGTRYTAEGPLRAPDGRDPWVQTVWFVERGARLPRLVTAYPC